MTERLPVYIDPQRFADSGRRLRGQLPLSGMERLTSALHSASGSVEVDLQFEVDRHRRVAVTGTLYAVLDLVCQRCMLGMPFAVQRAVRLAPVSDETEIEILAEGFEPMMLDENGLVALADLIEDELILALPMISTHAKADCSIRTEFGGDPETMRELASEPEIRRNPFEVLTGLKLG